MRDGISEDYGSVDWLGGVMWCIIAVVKAGVLVGALRKRTYSEVLRPSVARVKLRAAYSKASQVGFAGFLAGALSLATPALSYTAGAWVAQALNVPGPDFAGRMKWLVDHFGLAVTSNPGFEGILVNLIVLAVALGVVGMISAFVLKMSTISQDSSSFFSRRLKFPYEFLPFLILMLKTSCKKPSDVILGLISCMLIAFIWKFYYGKVLSVVSTVDVGKIIPDLDIR